MIALEEYMKRSREAINKENTRAVYNIDGYFEIKNMFLELQGYRKAYNRLLEEKRKLLEKVNKDNDVIDKDKVALEVISNVIDNIELNIELSKAVE